MVRLFVTDHGQKDSMRVNSNREHIGQTFLMNAPRDPAWGAWGILHPLIAVQEWTDVGPAIVPDGMPVP